METRMTQALCWRFAVLALLHCPPNERRNCPREKIVEPRWCFGFSFLSARKSCPMKRDGLKSCQRPRNCPPARCCPAWKNVFVFFKRCHQPLRCPLSNRLSVPIEFFHKVSAGLSHEKQLKENLSRRKRLPRKKWRTVHRWLYKLSGEIVPVLQWPPTLWGFAMWRIRNHFTVPRYKDNYLHKLSNYSSAAISANPLLGAVLLLSVCNGTVCREKRWMKCETVHRIFCILFFCCAMEHF